MDRVAVATAVVLVAVLLAGCSTPSADPDGDGVPNQVEDQFGTDRNDPDTDDDGLSDHQEIIEYRNRGPDPLKPDTDGDGLNDSEEVLLYDTKPDQVDTDDDGLTDFDEVLTYGQWGACKDEGDPPRCTWQDGPHPDRKDTDGDRFFDGDEIEYYKQFASEPQVIGSYANDPDVDGDGYADGEDGAPLADLSVRVEALSIDLTTNLSDSGGANLTMDLFAGNNTRSIHVGPIPEGRTDLDVSWTTDITDGPARPGQRLVSTALSAIHEGQDNRTGIKINDDTGVLVPPNWNLGNRTKLTTGPQTVTGVDGSLTYRLTTCRNAC